MLVKSTWAGLSSSLFLGLTVTPIAFSPARWIFLIGRVLVTSVTVYSPGISLSSLALLLTPSLISM